MDLISNYKEMSKVELSAKINELKEKKFYLEFKYKATNVKDLKEIRNLRKGIAHIFTVINGRKK